METHPWEPVPLTRTKPPVTRSLPRHALPRCPSGSPGGRLAPSGPGSRAAGRGRGSSRDFIPGSPSWSRARSPGPADLTAAIGPLMVAAGFAWYVGTFGASSGSARRSRGARVPGLLRRTPGVARPRRTRPDGSPRLASSRGRRRSSRRCPGGHGAVFRLAHWSAEHGLRLRGPGRGRSLHRRRLAPRSGRLRCSAAVHRRPGDRGARPGGAAAHDRVGRRAARRGPDPPRRCRHRGRDHRRARRARWPPGRSPSERAAWDLGPGADGTSPCRWSRSVSHRIRPEPVRSRLGGGPRRRAGRGAGSAGPPRRARESAP